MQTRKLYYEDGSLTEFSAQVLSCTPVDGGYEIILNETAFYPEGGGQACDLGTLGDVRVLDVQEKGEQVIHRCDGMLPVGSTVNGRIDWERRFDLMQQHTGEHIISGIIHDMFGYANSGFHVGKHLMEVDFDGLVPADVIERIETMANEAVWKDIPLRCWVPSPEELPTVVYRTKRALPWPVRIVQVPGYDSCACCGIHTATTGQVGLIKIVSCVKFHAGVRMEVACGRRAMEYLQEIFRQNRLVSQTFSARMLETGEAAVRFSEALAAEKYRNVQLQERLLEITAESYVNQENVLHITDDLTGGQLRSLADKIAGKCAGFAAVLSRQPDGSYGYCIASRALDLRPMGKALNGALNGRGGGKPGFQQGTLRAEEGQIREFFREQGA